jgi:hypothetical protein
MLIGRRRTRASPSTAPAMALKIVRILKTIFLLYQSCTRSGGG